MNRKNSESRERELEELKDIGYRLKNLLYSNGDRASLALAFDHVSEAIGKLLVEIVESGKATPAAGVSPKTQPKRKTEKGEMSK
jgi:hypothetical protein